MTIIPRLKCPTCGTEMQRFEDDGQPMWRCNVQDCPCISLKGNFKNE